MAVANGLIFLRLARDSGSGRGPAFLERKIGRGPHQACSAQVALEVPDPPAPDPSPSRAKQGDGLDPLQIGAVPFSFSPDEPHHHSQLRNPPVPVGGHRGDSQQTGRGQTGSVTEG